MKVELAVVKHATASYESATVSITSPHHAWSCCEN